MPQSSSSASHYSPPTTLAIDYGQRRIGLAISFASLAEPIGILANDEAFWANLDRIIDEYSVKQVLVGVSEGKSAKKARELGQKIAQFTRLPVVYTDETLSTKLATNKLIQAGKKINSKKLDHFAAAEFLQQWLDAKKYRY